VPVRILEISVAMESSGSMVASLSTPGKLHPDNIREKIILVAMISFFMGDHPFL
jgi:hypothetical protein